MATKPKTAAAKTSRPKQTEIPLKGKGVEDTKDKQLIEWADDYTEKSDAKAKLAEEMTGLETQILARMEKIGVETFRFADKCLKVSKGKNHIKIKTVKNDGDGGDEGDGDPAKAGLGDENKE